MLSPEEVRLRFLHPIAELGEAESARLASVDPRREFVLVAAEPLPPGEALVLAVALSFTGALVMAFARRRMDLKLMRQAMDTTAKLSTFVVFILLGARVFSLTFYGVNGHVWVEHLLSGLPGGQLGFLIVVNIVIFVLAFFLDFFELSFIVIPLLGPAAEKLGIDLIWFGVLLGVNMQTSFMHPPFGFALFYLRSVAPIHNEVPAADWLRGLLAGMAAAGIMQQRGFGRQLHRARDAPAAADHQQPQPVPATRLEGAAPRRLVLRGVHRIEAG